MKINSKGDFKLPDDWEFDCVSVEERGGKLVIKGVKLVPEDPKPHFIERRKVYSNQCISLPKSWDCDFVEVTTIAHNKVRIRKLKYVSFDTQ
jgi:hypothetical protein